MRSSRHARSILTTTTLLLTLSLTACGDDSSTGTGGDTSGGGGAGASGGAGGSGGQGAAGGSGGMGATGGSGGEGAMGGAGGAGGSAPEGAVYWTVDGNSHQTTDGFPPSADVQKPNPAVLTLTISATDAATFDSINAVVSVSAPSVMDVLAAGTYPCAPAGQLPSVTINAADGGTVYTSGGMAACSITFDEDVNVGTPVKGSASGTLDSNGTAVDFTMSFNLEDIPG